MSRNLSNKWGWREGWEKQPLDEREQHVRRPWGEKLLVIFEEPDTISEKYKGLLLGLYACLLLFSLGEDTGQQPQSSGEKGPLERESMSKSFEDDLDPDPRIRPGKELLQLQWNQWNGPRKRPLTPGLNKAGPQSSPCQQVLIKISSYPLSPHHCLC